jgi:hypothetical protein
MASQLVGLNRALTWHDFRQVTRTAPAPGQIANAAQTQTNVSSGNLSLPPMRGTRPQQYQLADTISVTIKFDAAQSWKASWIATLPQTDQDRILKHEQGHYDLVALLGRDFFIELMQLKTKTYSNLSGFRTDFGGLDTRYLKRIQPIQTKYDSETNHGRIQIRQDNWNAFINSAFTAPRVPPVVGPDGVPLKQPILDVLANAGIVL